MEPFTVKAHISEMDIALVYTERVKELEHKMNNALLQFSKMAEVLKVIHEDRGELQKILVRLEAKISFIVGKIQ